MNKNSKVLAFKIDQRFEDLIGQDVIAETIINSIKTNKVLMLIYLLVFVVLVKQQLQEF